jgi:hypothetical protein
MERIPVPTVQEAGWTPEQVWMLLQREKFCPVKNPTCHPACNLDTRLTAILAPDDDKQTQYLYVTTEDLFCSLQLYDL